MSHYNQPGPSSSRLLQPHPNQPPLQPTSPTSSTHSQPINISSSDLQFLRQTQHALGLSSTTSSNEHPSSSDSGATEPVPGLGLNPSALTALSTHFDSMMAAIVTRVQSLSEQTRASTDATHRRASHVVDRATFEIETMRDIMRQCEELETEFLKIQRLGEMVKGFKKRIEVLERKVGK